MLGTDDRLQRALDLAYRYLSRRDRTVGEVRRHLEQQGVSPETADGSIRTLIDQGYLDDVRFSRLYAADKRQLEQWGTERIRRGLLARGIDLDLTTATLADLEVDGEGGETELDRALGLLRRRFPAAPRDRRDRDRALGMLLRKGYDSELAVDALAAYARAEHRDPQPLD